MIFGWPYAMHHFSALQWLNTKLWKRLGRMVIGVAIAVGVDYFFEWCVHEVNDLATKYFFGHALPGFLTAYWVFGLFPIVCKWMGLVQREDELAKQFPEVIAQVAASEKLTRQNTLHNSRNVSMVSRSPNTNPSNRPSNQGSGGGFGAGKSDLEEMFGIKNEEQQQLHASKRTRSESVDFVGSPKSPNIVVDIE
mmetsp:Transcript_26007/g.32435  ORF Transcript_26007/g.32435 Transcript_26007/m.32435 type:complete len:194 (-) Transcript_26007:88-669(-)